MFQSANEIKTDANNLEIPTDNLTAPAQAARGRLDGFNATAKRQKEAIARAKNGAAMALNASQSARQKVEEVLRKLEELLSELDKLKLIDEATITDLENQLDNETFMLMVVDREIQDLETEHERIQARIKQYTLDLERLKKERLLVKKNFDSLPKKCPKLSNPTEGGNT